MSGEDRADKPLSGQEQDRLENFVEGGAGENALGWEPMPMDMLQGFLCGVASAPEEIGPEDWLPWAFGIEAWPDTRPEAAEWFELAKRYYRQLLPRLEGKEDIELILFDPTPEMSSRFEYWCVGFLDGLEVAAEPLDALGDPEEVDELLFPVRVLAGAIDETERKRVGEKEWARLLEDSANELWPSVVATYRYGSALRNKPSAIKRDMPKTGRNEPCPCGSGKKFKNCHGKTAG